MEGASVSSGIADLTLHEPGTITEDLLERVHHGSGEGDVDVVGEAPSAGETEAGPAEPVGPRAGRGRGWSPSREKVVWHWPDLEDRLVESLD